MLYLDIKGCGRVSGYSDKFSKKGTTYQIKIISTKSTKIKGATINIEVRSNNFLKYGDFIEFELQKNDYDQIDEEKEISFPVKCMKWAEQKLSEEHCIHKFDFNNIDDEIVTKGNVSIEVENKNYKLIARRKEYYLRIERLSIRQTDIFEYIKNRYEIPEDEEESNEPEEFNILDQHKLKYIEQKLNEINPETQVKVTMENSEEK